MSVEVLSGGCVITMDAGGTILNPGVVAFETGVVTFVGPCDSAPPPAGARVTDVSGCFVLPGLVNAHTHSPMTVLRGMADDVAIGDWLPRFADMGSWADDNAYRVSSAVGCAEMLLGGVTTIADRYGPLDPEASALQTAGIRAVVTSSVSDEAGEPACRHALDLLDALGTDSRRRVFGSLGPHATDTCSPPLLRWVAEVAERRSAQIYIHLAQGNEEHASARAQGYRDAAALLRDVGVVGEHVVAAHAIKIEEAGLDDLAETNTAIAHCPTSNARIEAKIGRVTAMLERGIRVGLGTDCAASNNSMDMFGEMKSACLLNKLDTGDPQAVPAELSLRLATVDGAAALGLSDLVGSIEIGKRADVIVVDGRHPSYAPMHDPVSSLVYSGSARDVLHVIVDGSWVVRDRNLLTLDLERELAELNKIRSAIAARNEPITVGGD